MEGKDQIKELFSEKLGNYEAKVNPDLWANVASQIGATSAAASTGMSLVAKWLIGLGISGAVATASILYFNSTEKSTEVQLAEDQTINVSEEKVDSKEENSVESSVVNNEVKANPEEVLPSNESEVPQNEEQTELEVPPFDLPSTLLDRDQLVPEIVVEDPEIPKTDENTVVTEEHPNSTVNEEETQEETAEEIPAINEASESNITYSINKLPNVFTPDGDRVNDEFFIESEGLLDFNIVVISNTNQIVFTSQNPDFRWDGRDLKGEKVPSGTYMYYITAKDSNENPVKEFSSLTIRR